MKLVANGAISLLSTKLVFWWKVGKCYEIGGKWGNFSTLFKFYEEKLLHLPPIS